MLAALLLTTALAAGGDGPLRLILGGNARYAAGEWARVEVQVPEDGHLLVLSTAGELQLCQPSDSGIQVLARTPVLEGKCWVLPVLSRHHLLCRSNAGEVVCLKLGD